MRSGIFFGYHQKLGGRWSGDLWIADWEQMERATHPTHIVPTRIRRGDVVANKLANGKFRFPIAEGALMLNYIKHRYADVDNSHKEFRTASQIAQSGERAARDRLAGQDVDSEVADRVDPVQDKLLSDSTQGNSLHLDPDGSHPAQNDYWTMPNHDLLIRWHVVPRTSLFTPTTDDCPLPLEWLDILRETKTDLQHAELDCIDDFWTQDSLNGARDLDEEWIGRTSFNILRPKPGKGLEWQNGRLTQVQTTTRPPTIWVEVWQGLTEYQKQKEIEKWKIEGPKREVERRRAKTLDNIPEADVKSGRYQQTMKDVKRSLQSPASPAMPVIPKKSVERSIALPLLARKDKYGNFVFESHDYADVLCPDVYNSKPTDDHLERDAPAGFVSHQWFAMVHKSIPMDKARRITKARAAVDAEFFKLDGRGFVDWDSVREKYEVVEDARVTKKKVHLGSLMTLCHEKNAELFLPEPDKEYKGRIVFRGDNIRDESGYLAVFSEQGTSASHLEAAKFMDAISRSYCDAGEMDGEESDALGAYTQCRLGGEETWTTIPKEYWPKHWHGKYTQPVVRLILNLYGHPLAGLYWELYCKGCLTKIGWEPVKGWECLYKHTKFKLYLSIYVDDFKMSGLRTVSYTHLTLPTKRIV